MRKLLLSLSALFLVAGLVIAADTVTLVKFDKETKKVTVKDKDGKESTYEITAKTKFVGKGKDGEKKEYEYDFVEKMLSSEKAVGKAQMDIEAKDGKLTEVTLKRGGGKGKGGDKKDDKQGN